MPAYSNGSGCIAPPTFHVMGRGVGGEGGAAGRGMGWGQAKEGGGGGGGGGAGKTSGQHWYHVGHAGWVGVMNSQEPTSSAETQNFARHLSSFSLGVILV